MSEERRRSVGATAFQRAIRAVLVAAAWLMVAGPAAAGTLSGTVRLSGAPEEPRKLPVTTDHAICGQEKVAEDLILSGAGGIRNVVVSLQTPPSDTTWKTPWPSAQMDQQQCVFIPRVVIVPVGGTVEFLNGDRLLHNIRSRNTANTTFNRTQPKDRTIPIAFTKPEIIRVNCDLHPWMRAWVVVAEHPFYAVTDDSGKFAITGIPPGKYTLQLWQEALGTMTRDVTVREGVTTITVEMDRK